MVKGQKDVSKPTRLCHLLAWYVPFLQEASWVREHCWKNKAEQATGELVIVTPLWDSPRGRRGGYKGNCTPLLSGLACSAVFPCSPAGSQRLRSTAAATTQSVFHSASSCNLSLALSSPSTSSQPASLDSSSPMTTISFLDHCNVPLTGLPAFTVTPPPSHPTPCQRETW